LWFLWSFKVIGTITDNDTNDPTKGQYSDAVFTLPAEVVKNCSFKGELYDKYGGQFGSVTSDEMSVKAKKVCNCQI